LQSHSVQEYLVSHGLSGALGRFASETPEMFGRGERVVVRTLLGLELGAVLCPANARQRRILDQTPVGRLLRRVSAADEVLSAQRRQFSQQLADAMRARAGDLLLPLEILDADVMLDGRQALVQCLAAELLDVDALIGPLEHQFGIAILLENLAAVPPAAEEQAGCGKPGCGHSAGGCSSCASGGCSSCSRGQEVDLRPYFAHLRAKMEEHSQRTPLL
jgi:hypothetical protein